MMPILGNAGETEMTNTNQVTDWAKAGLKSRVKCMRNYNAVPENGVLKKECLLSTVKFNNTGQIIDSCVFNSDGSLTLQYSFLYDTKGRKIQLHTIYPLDEFESKTVYRYDEQDNLIEECSYLANGNIGHRTTYKYDEHGKKIEECSYLAK